MVTMINDARRFKYKGWLTYDEMFRQSVAKSKSTCWSELNSTLYAITFLSQQQGDSVTCQVCSSSDHHTSRCALYEKRPLRPTSPHRGYRSRSPNRSTPQVCYAWNDGRCARGESCKFKHSICLKCGREHRAIHCGTYKNK